MSNLCATNVSTIPPFQDPSYRSTTPPFLKWLLSERAAIAGDIVRLSDLEAALVHKRGALSMQLCVTEQKIADAASKREAAKNTLNALTRTIELQYAQVNPSAAGVVKAHAGKYGKRGGLKGYIAQLLMAVGTGGVATSHLIQNASRQFTIPLTVRHEGQSLKKSVNSALVALQREGKAEILAAGGPHNSNIWHWTADLVPSFEEMIRSEQRVSNRDIGPYPDAS